MSVAYDALAGGSENRGGVALPSHGLEGEWLLGSQRSRFHLKIEAALGAAWFARDR
jgi:hypothetical protein